MYIRVKFILIRKCLGNLLSLVIKLVNFIDVSH